MYLVWAFLFYRAYSAGEWNPRKTFWMAMVAGTLMGIVLEYGQKFMHQGRSFEGADMIANTLGALIGALAGMLFRKLKRLSP